jgi:hypothetical protein
MINNSIEYIIPHHRYILVNLVDKSKYLSFPSVAHEKVVEYYKNKYEIYLKIHHVSQLCDRMSNIYHHIDTSIFLKYIEFQIFYCFHNTMAQNDPKLMRKTDKEKRY